MNLSRRQFIKRSLNLTAGCALSLFGGRTCAQECTEELELVEHAVAVKALPPEFHEYRLGFISDIHLGVFVKEQFFIRALETLTAAKIDLLILGGDYIFVPDSFVADSFASMSSSRYLSLSPTEANYLAFETIASNVSKHLPRDGVVALYGNHDRWTHATALSETFQRYKIPLHINEFFSIIRNSQELKLFCADDFLTGMPDLSGFLSQDDQPRILLSHNADVPGLALKNIPNCFDLAICGHSHGGQIQLPFFGAPITNALYPEFLQGMVTVSNMGKPDSKVFTSKGVGVVEFPYRIGARPDVAVLELKAI